MTQWETENLAKEIANQIPTGKKFALVRALAIVVITTLSTTISVTWVISTKYAIMVRTIEENNNDLKTMGSDIATLKTDVRLNTYKVNRCCPQP